MKYLSYLAACLLSGALLGACSSQDGTECPTCDQLETVAQPYSVSFKLGGSVSPATRAVTQTDEEKALTSLYAVVFADPDASGIGDGTENQASKEDLFVSAISVDLTNYNSGAATTPNLSFVLGEQGHYNICFVANPSGYSADGPLSGLAAKITGLEAGVSKVSDFEALVEESEPNLDNSFLMTSPYYAVTTAYTKQATIPEVTLTRAVARIDVLNQADGVTVQKLVFHNYGAQSLLINDAATFNAGYITPTKEFTPAGGLVGNSTKSAETDDNYYGKQIYTYEQYAGTGEEDSRPALEIIYTVPSLSTGQWFTHTVKFETATAPDGPATVVPLKRNNHYLVTLTNNNGQIEFTLGVKEWEEGYTFKTLSSDFAAGTQTNQQV